MGSESAGHATGGAGRYRAETWIVASIVVAFLASRAFGVANFVPHNDEVIYAEAASLTASDWEKNKFIFQSGRLYGDYKEPLQLWAMSLTIDWARDPLLWSRIWSSLLGAFGLVYLHRWATRIWNASVAHATASMVVLSDYYLYFDSIAINEAFLYGLGAAFIFYVYDHFETRRWRSGVLSLLLFLGMLLTKGSGIQWAALAAMLPVIVITKRPAQAPMEIARSLATMGLQLLAIVLAGRWLHGVVIPAQYTAIRDRKLARGFVRPLDELLEFPVRDWLETASFYWREVLMNELSLFLLPVVAIVIAAGVHLYRSDKRRFACYLTILAIYLASFVPMVLVAKVGFIRYFGMGLQYLYLAVAIALVELSLAWAPQTRRIAWGCLLACVVSWKLFHSWIPLAEWGQTDLSFRETPAGWANGSGIPALLDEVEALPPGVVVTDMQWGHPATTLEVYRHRFPQLELRRLSKKWLEAPLLHAQEVMKTPNPNLYFVFDARTPGIRRRIDRLVSSKMLCGNKKVIEKRYRDQVLRDSNLTICTADLERSG